MSYRMEFDDGTGIVRITGLGVMTIPDLVQLTTDTLQFLEENKTRLILIDCASFVADIDTLEIYNHPGIYDELEAPRDNRVALLPSEDQNTNVKMGFFVELCRNRGRQFQIFSTEEEATEWLLE